MQVFTKAVRYCVLSAVVSFGFFRENPQWIFLGLTGAACLIWLVWKLIRSRSWIKAWWLQRKEEIANSAARRRKKALSRVAPAEPLWEYRPGPRMQEAAVRHLNCRITDRIQSVYPQATCEWVSPNSAEIAMQGGEGRIRISGAGTFDHADVAVNAMARLKLTLLHTVELDRAASYCDSPKGPGNQAERRADPKADVEAWCDLIGRSALYNLSARLAEKGFRLLSVDGNGTVCAINENVREPQFKLGEMPSKEFWHTLAQLLTDEAHQGIVEEDALLLKW